MHPAPPLVFPSRPAFARLSAVLAAPVRAIDAAPAAQEAA
jgi:hypothetical protein